MLIKTMIVILACISISACNSKGKPILKYSESVINVGDIKSGVAYGGEFSIRNAGSADLQIGEINTDCSCTIANIANKVVKPGDSIFVKFQVNPHAPGLFQQKIIVSNNSENANPAMFLVRGNVTL